AAQHRHLTLGPVGAATSFIREIQITHLMGDSRIADLVVHIRHCRPPHAARPGAPSSLLAFSYSQSSQCAVRPASPAINAITARPVARAPVSAPAAARATSTSNCAHANAGIAIRTARLT